MLCGEGDMNQFKFPQPNYIRRNLFIFSQSRSDDVVDFLRQSLVSYCSSGLGEEEDIMKPSDRFTTGWVSFMPSSANHGWSRAPQQGF